MTSFQLDIPPFRPRAPWWGADLQTVRNYVLRDYADLSAWPGEELVLPMDNGDRLNGFLHQPATMSGRSLAILIHGFTGCADSAYMMATARHLLTAGYPVLRLNLRGAAPIRAHCRELYHAGRSGDFRTALAQLTDRITTRRLIAIGFSLGGNMLLKYSGEEGASTPLTAAVSVSAPIDLAMATRRIGAWRNRLYHRWLVAHTKSDWLSGRNMMSEEQRQSLSQSRSLFSIDDAVVGPLNGFAGADDYYERCAAKNFLNGVAVPTLVLHAADDPWIPEAMYRRVDWAANTNLVPVITPGGGHVGFHGRDGRWHDRVIEQFIGQF